MDIFSSTIIPTINRSTLSRAVRSVLDQKFNASGFEVIVVNDSGQPLPDMDWQHSPQVRVIHTNRRERSVARNTGAAIAYGKYLHFLDDDDVMVPGALDVFWQMDQSHHAIWLYGGYQTVDNAGEVVCDFTPDLNGNIFAYLICGEGIPFQASFLNTKSFFSAGGYDPKFTGVEDRDLGRQFALLGEVVTSNSIVAQIRIGEVGSTTDWSTLAEKDRRSREKALRDFNSFKCLRESAKSNYMHGRVSRAYFASMVWNINHFFFLRSASRAVTGLFFAIPAFITRDFWMGLKTKIGDKGQNCQ